MAINISVIRPYIRTSIHSFIWTRKNWDLNMWKNMERLKKRIYIYICIYIYISIYMERRKGGGEGRDACINACTIHLFILLSVCPSISPSIWLHPISYVNGSLSALSRSIRLSIHDDPAPLIFGSVCPEPMVQSQLKGQEIQWPFPGLHVEKGVKGQHWPM